MFLMVAKFIIFPLYLDQQRSMNNRTEEHLKNPKKQMFYQQMKLIIKVILLYLIYLGCFSTFSSLYAYSTHAT